MAKRGGTKHMKRLASPKAMGLHDKKARKWLINTAPGPHPKKHALPLAVLLRDVLKVVDTAREAKRVLAARRVEVDGRVRSDDKFPVGLMDVVSLPLAGKQFRIFIDRKCRLMPVEISKEEAASKIVRVVKKHTVPGGKLNLTFHDGRNMLGDNHVRVGDSVVLSLPVVKMGGHLRRDKGCRCLIVEGKHAGSVVKLKELIQRKGGKPSEAVVEAGGEEFITVAKYLFVVDDAFTNKAG